MNLFELIEFELDIPPGRLRPVDKLVDMFTPAPTKNPFKWLTEQVQAGDREFAVQQELMHQLRRRGLKPPKHHHLLGLRSAPQPTQTFRTFTHGTGSSARALLCSSGEHSMNAWPESRRIHSHIPRSTVSSAERCFVGFLTASSSPLNRLTSWFMGFSTVV